MLNGIDPIILIKLYKVVGTNNDLNKIPVVSDAFTKLGYAVIPIYLSEQLTGLFIDSEEKNVDITTETETKEDGTSPDVKQKGVGVVTRINLQASGDSIGLTLLSALIDQVFEKVSSKEYSITYLHKAVTIFDGLLHSFQISQNANDDRYNVTIEIARGDQKTTTQIPFPTVTKVTGTAPL
jgi:hypothetical protein